MIYYKDGKKMMNPVLSKEEYLASLFAPPSTRFVCNPAESALVSEKEFRSNSMSETACCCQRNAVSLLEKRSIAVCAFTAS